MFLIIEDLTYTIYKFLQPCTKRKKRMNAKTEPFNLIFCHFNKSAAR